VTSILTQPVSAAPKVKASMTSLSRWLQVVSHLDPKYGGLSSAVPAVGRSVAQTEGFDVSLAGFCAPEEHFKPVGFDSEHLSFWPISRKSWLQDRVGHSVIRKAFEEQVRTSDGIHIHGLWEQSTAIAASTARTSNKPYVLSAHGMLEPWALANKPLRKFVYGRLVERNNVARATSLHALTLKEVQHFRSFGARNPIAVIPNGVDIPERVDSQLFFNAFPSLEGKRIVLFLARLHTKKGLDLLIESWSAIASDYPDAHLVLAGPDSDGTRPRLEQLILARNVTDSVTFTGMLQDAMKWSALAGAEAFALPSFSEGLSVSVLEAMGMSLPVIVTEPCNMPEVVSHDAGWQIQPDVAELTDVLRELLTNSPIQNQAIGRRGARLVQTRYTWPIIATQLAELYRWVLGGPTPISVDVHYPA
jgi:glycosyltransferase involved in cell wall biosynthesis